MRFHIKNSAFFSAHQTIHLEASIINRSETLLNEKTPVESHSVFRVLKDVLKMAWHPNYFLFFGVHGMYSLSYSCFETPYLLCNVEGGIFLGMVCQNFASFEVAECGPSDILMVLLVQSIINKKGGSHISFQSILDGIGLVIMESAPMFSFSFYNVHRQNLSTLQKAH